MIQLLRDYYGVDERWRFTDTHRAADRGPARPARPRPRRPRALDEAVTRDEVVEALLARLPALLPPRGLLHRARAVGARLERRRRGRGPRAWSTGLRIPLDQPSVFQTVTRDRTLFIGRLGPEEENQRFLKALGKRPQHQRGRVPGRRAQPGGEPRLRRQRARAGTCKATWAS